MPPKRNTTICTICGDEFARAVGVRGRPAITCSIDCRNHLRTTLIRHCQWCATAFNKNSEDAEDAFCSVECLAKHRALRDPNHGECENCGNWLTSKAFRFCNTECATEASQYEVLVCRRCEQPIKFSPEPLQRIPRYCGRTCRDEAVHGRGLPFFHKDSLQDAGQDVVRYLAHAEAYNRPPHYLLTPTPTTPGTPLGGDWPAVPYGGLTGNVVVSSEIVMPEHWSRSLRKWEEVARRIKDSPARHTSTPGEVLQAVDALLWMRKPASHPFMILPMHQLFQVRFQVEAWEGHGFLSRVPTTYYRQNRLWASETRKERTRALKTYQELVMMCSDYGSSEFTDSTRRTEGLAPMTSFEVKAREWLTRAKVVRNWGLSKLDPESQELAKRIAHQVVCDADLALMSVSMDEDTEPMFGLSMPKDQFVEKWNAPREPVLYKEGARLTRLDAYPHNPDGRMTQARLLLERYYSHVSPIPEVGAYVRTMRYSNPGNELYPWDEVGHPMRGDTVPAYGR